MINDKGEFVKVSKIRKKKIKKTNILLGFICVLLAILLGFILVTSYKSEQKESRHLSEIADDQQSGIEDYEAVKERAKELEEISSEEAEDTEDIKSKNTEDTEKTDTAETEDADKTEDTKDETAAAASGIVCWGDDLINGEESNTYSYMEVLQKLLTDNGYNMKDDYMTSLEFTEGVYNQPIKMVTIYFQDGSIRNETPLTEANIES